MSVFVFVDAHDIFDQISNDMTSHFGKQPRYSKKIECNNFLTRTFIDICVRFDICVPSKHQGIREV